MMPKMKIGSRLSTCFIIVLLGLAFERGQASQSAFRRRDYEETPLQLTQTAQLTFHTRRYEEAPLQFASAGKPKMKSKKWLKGLGDIWEDGEAEGHVHHMDVPCNAPVVADANFDPKGRCPDMCPFLAEDHGAARFCTFQCVTADKCALHDPHKPIADGELGVCRGPSVSGCKEPMTDGTDRCAECRRGYSLQPDGHCHYKAVTGMIIACVVFGILVALVVIWIVDLCIRPITNPGAENAGEGQRESMKIKLCKNRGKRHSRHGLTLAESHADELEDFQGMELLTQSVSQLGETMGKRLSVSQLGETMGKRLSMNKDEDEGGEGDTSRSGAAQHESNMEYYPITTNLCRTDVAGPGVSLHFNFQAMIIAWVLLMSFGWLVLGVVVDTDLFVLGSRQLGTPAQNCFVVAWGYETQHDLMWAKVAYLIFAYVSSFVLALLHSIRQMRLFDEMDNSYKTMQDYALMIDGLPMLKGDATVNGESPERAIKTALKKQFGIEAVGVSIAWNYKEQAEQVEVMCKQVLHRNHDSHAPRKEDDATGFRRNLKLLEKALFLAPTEDEECREDVRELLQGLNTSRCAFVVCQTEAERDAAVKKVNEEVFKFEGCTCSASAAQCEPTTVAWSNFDDTGASHKCWRCFKGFGQVLCALGLWFVVFYAPYAWSVYNFNYDNGRQPGFIYGFSFSMIVVVGNNMMYTVCESVSTKMGFRFKDEKEAYYMVFYTIACMLQVLLDFVTTYYSAWSITKGLGLKTYDGRSLEEVSMFPEGFETYAIQRSLAQNTYDYAFPSTFLIPFLLEPFVNIALPYLLTKVIIRTHSDVMIAEAEDAHAPVPMDMSRYGDVMLNVVIFTMIMYFPGAYTAKLGIIMALCHVYIYCFDHYRVLRCVPNCMFANYVIDWWSQVMMAPCCALILSILVYKASVDDAFRQTHTFRQSTAWSIIGACSVAFFLHCIVHVLLLVYVVPLFAKQHEDLDKEGKTTYSMLAEQVPSNWFNANPVHCLRSKYLHQHDPPCMYMMPGREDLQQVNTDEGLYFDGKKSMSNLS